MLQVVKNKKGSVVVGFMAVLFALSVSAGYFSLSRTSAKSLSYDYDLLMTTELGFSANERIEQYASALKNSFGEVVICPPREIEISENSSFFERRYLLEGKAERLFNLNTIETGVIKAAGEVTVVDDGYDAGKYLYKDSKNKPMNNTASTIKNESYAGYFWLTKDDYSENDEGLHSDEVWWWGDDYVVGKCHTNTEFSIKNVPGHDSANNDGWPLFLDPVTQTFDDGINWHSSPGPEEDIFQGYPVGFADGQPEVEFLETAKLARANGAQPFSSLNETDIVFLDFDGSPDVLIGYVDFTPVQVPVYASYPWPGNNYDTRTAYIDTIPSPPEMHFDANFDPEIHMIIEDTINFQRIEGGVGPVVAYNNFVRRDTTWEFGGTLNPGTYFMEQELWVKGVVSGRYTLASAEDIYIIDNILYDNTPMGDDPVTNDTDMLGMVSEQKIKIRYGYADPNPSSNNPRYKPNSDDVVIYSAICALGPGNSESDSRNQGIFTYDYHDPHPSTPYWHEWYPGTDSAFVEDFPSDLHMFTYPQTAELPWPSIPNYDDSQLFLGLPDQVRQFMYDALNVLIAGGPGDRVLTYPPTSTPYNGIGLGFKAIDYPWRNPLWPDVPRDGAEPNSDYERGKIEVWGGIHCIRRGFVHRSGSDPNNHNDENEWNLEEYIWGPSSQANGYDKDYHYDNRFRYLAPDNYPEANLKGGSKLGGFSVYSFQKKTN